MLLKFFWRNKLFYVLLSFCILGVVYIYLLTYYFSRDENVQPLVHKGISHTTEVKQQPASANVQHINKLDTFLLHDLHSVSSYVGQLKEPIPKFQLGNITSNSEIIIGITTIKRDGAEYLLDTISSLLSNREEEDGAVKLVIFIGETNLTYVQAQSEKIAQLFPGQFRSGLIQVISPPESYYPEWNISLYENFNDPFERLKWRSKQNLDQIFLMLHIYHLSPTYYLMMEDDVIARKGYDKKILAVANERKNQDWFYISFCSLGAIGKLFRRSKLPSYAAFIHIFWNKKPLDWLQNDFLTSAYCSGDESVKQCQERCNIKTPAVIPALFQHVGKFSSLKGKIQSLKDKSFKSNS